MIGMQDLFDMVATEARDGADPGCIDRASPEEVHKRLLEEAPDTSDTQADEHEYRGCGYQGYEFGGGYLDSQCFGGWLQDMDSDYDSREMDYKPCPQCRQVEAMDYYHQQFRVSGDPRRSSVRDAWHLVMDIRRNRGLGSISLRRYRRHVEIVNARERRKARKS